MKKENKDKILQVFRRLIEKIVEEKGYKYFGIEIKENGYDEITSLPFQGENENLIYVINEYIEIIDRIKEFNQTEKVLNGEWGKVALARIVAYKNEGKIVNNDMYILDTMEF